MRKRQRERKYKGKERKEETRASRYRLSSVGHKGFSKGSVVKRERGKKEENGKVKESLRKYETKTKKKGKRNKRKGRKKDVDEPNDKRNGKPKYVTTKRGKVR